MRFLVNLLFAVLFAACSPEITPTIPLQPTSTPIPSSAPPLTLGVWHDLFYYDQLGKVVLVNGGPESGKSADDPLELWSWDGERWSLLSADPNGPRWRNFAGITYDSLRKVLVLYGGLQSESQNFEDTWEWDGKTWKQFTDQGPGLREGAAMAYDGVRGKVVLFGGAQAARMMNDTWEWDGGQWNQLSSQGPEARFPAAFAYDPVRQNLLLFGGHAFDAQGIATFGDTWTWDGTSWQEILAQGPSARDGADAIFSLLSNEIFLFGGAEIEANVTLLNDTWLWDGNQWNEIEAGGPPARVHPAMAFDEVRSRIVMTGGSNAPSMVLSDTWEWDGQQWACLAGCK
jgi:hypothetical protein